MAGDVRDFYDDGSAVDDYLAHRHAPVHSPNLVMEEPAFLAEVGDLTGQRILDLGCGDGAFALECLRAECASYLGIDSSPEMISRAQRAVAGSNNEADEAADGFRPSVRFVEADIEDLGRGRGRWPVPVDLVTSRMALHYVADLEPVFAAVRGAMAPDGRFVFSVVHPIITAAESAPDGPRASHMVDDYFLAGPRRRRWFDRQVEWQHRTVEHYVTWLVDAGFVVTSLRECEPVEALFAGDRAEYERRLRVPVFLLLSAGLT